MELARELLDNGHQVAISVAFLETLGALENALVAGSDAQATGSIARVKDICQKCHDQKWSK